MSSSNLLRILSILVLLGMRGIAFANDPSGVRVNENPHPSFEIFIPLTILIIFAAGYLLLKVGVLLEKSKSEAKYSDENLKKTKDNKTVVKRYSQTSERSTISFKSSIRPRHSTVDLYLLQAAQSGSAEAQYQLANWYYNESLVDDYAFHYSREAMKWYKNAAAQGHIGAQKQIEKLKSGKIK